MASKQKKKKIIKRILLILIISLIFLLTILTMMNLEVITKIKNLSKKPTLFIIPDECSLILSNIVHKIKNEDECKIVCINECVMREMKFHESEFVIGNNSCHTCNCYCK